MLEAQLLYPARVRSRPHSIYIAETYHQKIGEYNMGRGKEKVPPRVPERGLGRCLLGLPSYSFALGTPRTGMVSRSQSHLSGFPRHPRFSWGVDM